jgi:hypothetical protein
MPFSEENHPGSNNDRGYSFDSRVLVYDAFQ